MGEVDRSHDRSQRDAADGGRCPSGNVRVEADEFVARDKITVGDIDGSVAAIGAGAQAIYQNVERALTEVEIAQQAEELARKRLAESVTAYVQRLERQAERARQDPGTGSPYKALLQYDVQDTALFFGRSGDIASLLAHLQRDQLTVLHAESGAGKTSLLKAGIMPRLLADGHLPLYVRPYQTPVHQAVKRSLVAQLDDTPSLATASLHDFLRWVTDLLGGQQLVIIVDQFEEVFTVQSNEERDKFVNELVPCLADDLLPVRWILAVRAELLSRLGTFRPQLQDPLANEMVLRPLTREQAEKVIIEPALLREVTYEPDLIDHLLDDLGREEIAPPQLQLVCSALFEALEGQSEISAALYHQADGASGILRGHLERVLSRDIPPGSRKAARSLLEALVTAEKRRALRRRDDLAAELSEQGVAEATLDEVLAQLVDSRLLRVEERGEEGEALAYELVSDYLLGEIELDPAVKARKAAQELLDQEVAAWKRNPGFRIPADRFDTIAAQKPKLTLNEDAKVLLELSRRHLQRRRRFVLAGAGVVAVLVVLAILSVIAAIGAGLSRDQAQRDRDIAATQAGEAVATQRAAEATADVAQNLLDRAKQVEAELFEGTGIVALEREPSALAFDGSRLWVAAGGALIPIDPATGQSASLDTRQPAEVWSCWLGVETENLIFARGQLWATVADGVQAIDPGTCEARNWQVGSPNSLVFDRDAARLWVSTHEKGIQQIDLDSGRISETWRAEGTHFVLAFDGEWLWITDSTSVWKMHSDTREIKAHKEYVGGDFGDLAVAQGWLWAADGKKNQIWKLDLLTLEVKNEIAVDGLPLSLRYDGTRLWVITSNGVAQALDPITDIAGAPLPVGRSPKAIEFDGERIWVANSDDKTVQAIHNLAQGDAGSPVPVGGYPDRLALAAQRVWVLTDLGHGLYAIDPANNQAFPPTRVISHTQDLAYDGQSMWVTSDSGVYTVDSNGYQVTGPLLAEHRFGSLVFDGEQGQMWLASDDGVHVLGVDTKKSIAHVPVGDDSSKLLFDGQHMWITTEDALLAFDAADPQADPLFAFVGSGYRLFFDGEHLWIAGAGKIQALDPASGDSWTSFDFNTETTCFEGMAFDGIRLWVTTELSDTYGCAVQALDPGDGSMGEPIKLAGFNPSAPLFDGRWIWVGSQTGVTGVVQSFDPETGQPALSVQVVGPIADLIFDETDNRLWLTNQFGHSAQYIIVHK
jgi:DNA-binding beta-propeller fold protein YncE